MMNNKTSIPIVVVWFIFITLACQLPVRFGDIDLGLEEQETAPAVEWPHSTFVSPRDVLKARVDEPLEIDTYHVSRAKLNTLTIEVNRQALPYENLPPQTATFPQELAEVTVLVDGQPVRTGQVQPRYPTSAWSVPLIWVGRAPGTYELRLKSSDQVERESDFVVQRIEVVRP